MKRIVLLTAIYGLTACGGTSVPVAFNERLQDYALAQNALGLGDGVPDNFTDPTTFRNSGTGEYSGQMALIVRSSGVAGNIALTQSNLANEGMMGDINITANFATNGGTLSGSATNFVNVDNSNVSGSLLIATTEIDRFIGVMGTPDQVSFRATRFSGSLTNTPIGPASLDGFIAGGFADPNAAIWGIADGDAGGGNSAFRGSFVAPEN